MASKTTIWDFMAQNSSLSEDELLSKMQEQYTAEEIEEFTQAMIGMSQPQPQSELEALIEDIQSDG